MFLGSSARRDRYPLFGNAGVDSTTRWMKAQLGSGGRRLQVSLCHGCLPLGLRK